LLHSEAESAGALPQTPRFIASCTKGRLLVHKPSFSNQTCPQLGEHITKRNLWMICIIDMVIAALYHYDIVHEPVSEYTEYLLTEIWIRPTITYGLVACFVSETKENPELT